MCTQKGWGKSWANYGFGLMRMWYSRVSPKPSWLLLRQFRAGRVGLSRAISSEYAQERPQGTTEVQVKRACGDIADSSYFNFELTSKRKHVFIATLTHKSDMSALKWTSVISSQAFLLYTRRCAALLVTSYVCPARLKQVVFKTPIVSHEACSAQPPHPKAQTQKPKIP